MSAPTETLAPEAVNLGNLTRAELDEYITHTRAEHERLGEMLEVLLAQQQRYASGAADPSNLNSGSSRILISPSARTTDQQPVTDPNQVTPGTDPSQLKSPNEQPVSRHNRLAKWGAIAFVTSLGSAALSRVRHTRESGRQVRAERAAERAGQPIDESATILPLVDPVQVDPASPVQPTPPTPPVGRRERLRKSRSNIKEFGLPAAVFGSYGAWRLSRRERGSRQIDPADDAQLAWEKRLNRRIIVLGGAFLGLVLGKHFGIDIVPTHIPLTDHAHVPFTHMPLHGDGDGVDLSPVKGGFIHGPNSIFGGAPDGFLTDEPVHKTGINNLLHGAVSWHDWPWQDHHHTVSHVRPLREGGAVNSDVFPSKTVTPPAIPHAPVPDQSQLPDGIGTTYAIDPHSSAGDSFEGITHVKIGHVLYGHNYTGAMDHEDFQATLHHVGPNGILEPENGHSVVYTVNGEPRIAKNSGDITFTRQFLDFFVARVKARAAGQPLPQ